MSSIARLAGGDLIVSSRHTSTIYRISAQDGSIIWRLGGKASDFRLQAFNFSSQHDVRVLDETAKTMTLSFFDNKYNTFTPPQGVSSGKIIELNLSTKTVRLVQQFDPPRADFQSGDGGSVQVLPNGNVFIGWGRIPYVSEHEADGRLVYAARFGGIGSSIYSYRAFKGAYDGIQNPA
ncbi:MAG: hypothetical protein Q9183_005172 [Haloplaca sp. 2 TL-2023]